jgi:uncharacterized membrane protein YoaK (UPF0700 family)
MRALALCYAALAGAVDAIGFLKSGGFFVAFMSGNSTRLAIGVTDAGGVAAAAAALIGLFVLGVVLNVLVSESVRAVHRKVAATLGVSLFLLAAVAADAVGSSRGGVACLCLAMGASNAIFRRDGEVSIGVTYMTGTLVKLGHRLADALRGSGDGSWLPYLLLWLALVLGGIAGALCFAWSAPASLRGVAAASLVLAAVTQALTGHTRPPAPPAP